MAQHDMDLANAIGSVFRADANAALLALVSQNSGATAPAMTFAYQWWADTTTGILKQRNAANSGWVAVLNLSTGVQTGPNGSTVLPNGTTAQRDVSPAAGYLRYNTTTTTFEGYNGSVWGSIGGSGSNTFAQSNLTVAAGTGLSLVGPLTLSGTTTISGRLVVL